MAPTYRPRLRPHLALARIDPRQAGGREFVLHDRVQLSSAQLLLTSLDLEYVKLIDGQRTLPEIQAEMVRRLGGRLVPLETVASLIDSLDQALFLDSPRFHRLGDGNVRFPRCIGVYEADPVRLRRQMHGLFRQPGAAGPPGRPQGEGRLRAVLAPHVDYHRGGLVYTYAFRELFENTNASLFVIIGTSHYCGWRRFTLTRKDFQTPLGIVPTDQAYIDRLVRHHGGDLFQDEIVAHLPEHSIELEVVFLQYLYENLRPIRIVPLLVGSFEDCVQAGESPAGRDDVQRMIHALRQAERETPESICYVISGDLAHIGPKFGADRPVNERQLAHSRRQDAALLEQTEKASANGYFEVIAHENDERSICGFPPTWVTLSATQPSQGKVLSYDQYVEPNGHESVSFASVAFYR